MKKQVSIKATKMELSQTEKMLILKKAIHDCDKKWLANHKSRIKDFRQNIAGLALFD